MRNKGKAIACRDGCHGPRKAHRAVRFEKLNVYPTHIRILSSFSLLQTSLLPLSFSLLRFFSKMRNFCINFEYDKL